jgi:hypothetical protein
MKKMIFLFAALTFALGLSAQAKKATTTPKKKAQTTQVAKKQTTAKTQPTAVKEDPKKTLQDKLDARPDIRPDYYISKKGKLYLVKDNVGKPIEKAVTLADGSVVNPDGKYVKPNGEIDKLNDGIMINMKGEYIPELPNTPAEIKQKQTQSSQIAMPQ